MAVSELNVSIFRDVILLELFEVKGKKRVLVRKHYESYKLPLSDLNKIDVLDLERVVNTFLERGSKKRGSVNLLVFGDMGIDVFHELTVSVAKESLVKRALPLQIEQNIGKDYLNYSMYRYEILGEDVKLFFMKRNVVELLSQMRLYGNFEISSIVPGALSYGGLITTDGAMLEIGSEDYTLYGFRGGYLKSVVSGKVHTNYSMDRSDNPEKMEIFGLVRDDALTLLNEFNLNNDLDVDLITVVFTGSIPGEFEGSVVDGITFDISRDLRNWFSESAGEYIGEDVHDEFVPFAGSIGYTYLGNDRKRFDFSPDKLSYVHRNTVFGSFVFSMLLVASLGGTSLLVDNQLASARDELVVAEKNLEVVKSDLVKVNEDIKLSDSQIDDYNAYVSSLERLSTLDRNFISGVLGYLPENTPSSIVVDEVSLKKGTKTLVLHGESNTYKDIGAFAIELEKFGVVSIRDIKENSLLNNAGYPFEIELRSN